MIDINELCFNPAKYFNNPGDVVKTENLSRDEKIRILKAWDMDARELEVATEENMPGDDSDFLRQIHKALRALGYEADLEHAGTTKHGET